MCEWVFFEWRVFWPDIWANGNFGLYRRHAQCQTAQNTYYASPLIFEFAITCVRMDTEKYALAQKANGGGSKLGNRNPNICESVAKIGWLTFWQRFVWVWVFVNIELVALNNNYFNRMCILRLEQYIANFLFINAVMQNALHQNTPSKPRPIASMLNVGFYL